MKLRFKERIAFYNTIAEAITIGLIFIAIYGVVYYTAFRHLDRDILFEKNELMKTLIWKENTLVIDSLPEWEEAEHKKFEINPTIIQISDTIGHILVKSANLQDDIYSANHVYNKDLFYNKKIGSQRFRLGQFPIFRGEINAGYLILGISQEESHNVLENLFTTLCVSFPVLLTVLFFVVYFAASKSIAPVNKVIQTTKGIRGSTLNTRLELPQHKDEVYQLTHTINELLDRIETSVEQQKQFIADASHEIRTPLTAMKGILEVLIRKKREPDYYEEKIKDVIGQADRLNQLLEQLLQLARLESGGGIQFENINLRKAIGDSIAKFSKSIEAKAILVDIQLREGTTVRANAFFLSLILDNLMSNAINYGEHSIKVMWKEEERSLSISNDGLTIKAYQVPLVFNRFYRGDDSRSSQVRGSGLGLAIVKKLVELQLLNISVKAFPGETIFDLHFPA